MIKIIGYFIFDQFFSWTKILKFSYDLYFLLWIISPRVLIYIICPGSFQTGGVPRWSDLICSGSWPFRFLWYDHYDPNPMINDLLRRPLQERTFGNNYFHSFSDENLNRKNHSRNGRCWLNFRSYHCKKRKRHLSPTWLFP